MTSERLPWSDETFLLDDEAMDETHREFVALLNKLDAAADKELFCQCFAQLLEHTRQHFEAENLRMQQSGFPAIGEHQGEHLRILGELEAMRRMVERGRLALPRAYIREKMPDWFRLHAATMDSALAVHLKHQVSVELT